MFFYEKYQWKSCLYIYIYICFGSNRDDELCFFGWKITVD